MTSHAIGPVILWFAAICGDCRADDVPTEVLTFSVPEHAEAGFVLGSVNTTNRAPAQFDITDTDAARFVHVDPVSGKLTLRRQHRWTTGEQFRFPVRRRETAPAEQDPFALEFVSSLMEEGISEEELATLNQRTTVIHVVLEIADVPDAPQLADAEFAISESSAASTLVGTLHASDADRRDTLRYSLMSGNMDRAFVLDSESGQLRLSSDKPLHFETAPFRKLTVSVTDQNDLTSVATVFVEILDVVDNTPAIPDDRGQQVVHADPGKTAPVQRTPTPAVTTKSDGRIDSRSSPPAPSVSTEAGTTKQATAANPPQAATQIAGADASSTTAGTGTPIVDADNASSWKPAVTLATTESNAGSPGLNEADGDSISNSRHSAQTESSTESATQTLDAAPIVPAGNRLLIIMCGTFVSLCLVGGTVTVLFIRRRIQAEEQQESADVKESSTSEVNDTPSAKVSSSAQDDLIVQLEQRVNEAAAETNPESIAAAATATKQPGNFDADDDSSDPESWLSDDYYDGNRRHTADSEVHSLANSAEHTEERVCAELTTIESALNALIVEPQNMEQNADESTFQPVGTVHKTISAEFGSTSDPIRERLRAAGIEESSVEQSMLASNAASWRMDAASGQITPVSSDFGGRESDDLARSHEAFSSNSFAGPPDGRILDSGTEFDDADSSFRSGDPNPANVESVIAASTGALRAELAELFELHKKSQTEPEAKAEGIVEPEGKTAEPGASHETPEQEHQNSVARYLDGLLQKKRTDDIFADRRKNSEATPGQERRKQESGKSPVSFIESYLAQHGGKLPESTPSASSSTAVTTTKNGENSGDEAEAPTPVPRIPRTPVDVLSIREHMTSFREVASRSLESALVLHQMKQVKGRLALRTTLIMALIIVTLMIYIAEQKGILTVRALPYLMILAVIAAVSELGFHACSFWLNRMKVADLARIDSKPEKTSLPPETTV